MESARDVDIYGIWSKMKDRCLNPNSKAFYNYGGRGIKVCERWLIFENFKNDVGDRPSKKHSLDRFPNNNGDYEPNNFRWATAKQQSNNRRNNKIIEYNGLSKTHREWEEFLDMGQGRLRKLLHKDFKEVYEWYYPKKGLKKTSENWVHRKNELHSMSKKVYCFNNNTEYPSVCEAARVLGIGFGSIASVCRGRSKQTQGYTFKYI